MNKYKEIQYFKNKKLHFYIHQIHVQQIFNMIKILFECLNEEESLNILLRKNNIDDIIQKLGTLVISEEKFNKYRN